MAVDLESRLTELRGSLGEYKADDFAPSPIGKVFNALLKEAKNAKAGDPVVAAIEPVALSRESEFADIDCGALKALIKQLLSALEE